MRSCSAHQSLKAPMGAHDEHCPVALSLEAWQSCAIRGDWTWDEVGWHADLLSHQVLLHPPAWAHWDIAKISQELLMTCGAMVSTLQSRDVFCPCIAAVNWATLCHSDTIINRGVFKTTQTNNREMLWSGEICLTIQVRMVITAKLITVKTPLLSPGHPAQSIKLAWFSVFPFPSNVCLSLIQLWRSITVCPCPISQQYNCVICHCLQSSRDKLFSPMWLCLLREAPVLLHALFVPGAEAGNQNHPTTHRITASLELFLNG